MVHNLVRSPKALGVLLFGTILGAVWAAGSTAAAAPKPSGVSIQAGAGLQASPNPITSTGTISVLFGGNGSAASVSHSDHTHDGLYLPLSGGTVNGSLGVSGNANVGASASVGGNLTVSGPATLGSTAVGGSLNVGGNTTIAGTLSVGGNLSFGPTSQLIAPRVENAGSAPLNPAPGQLYWNTATQTLQVYDGTQWNALAAGGAASPILGAVTTQNQFTGTSGLSLSTAATLTFTLASASNVLIEFGAEYDIDSSTNYANFTLTPFVDNVAPPFPGDTAEFHMNSSNNVTYWTGPFSKPIIRSLSQGSHTVLIKVTFSAQQPVALRNPWLKVTKL
jgi:hypothetical protein